ncbi:NACHT domain-containing protein [Chryseobacterium sp. 22458]|uniref:NACHT domain-containing protein n=1 Tax=Chryseobacterium sp. 22458 TaxID=3453921 RepID=UPI003F8783A3
MYNKEKLVEAIKNYPENNLTKNIIIPLLETLGYNKVEFFGGTSEEGKDIVFWENDPMGDTFLNVAQVKHFKFTNSSNSSNSFQTVANQLAVCFNKKVPHSDGFTQKPSKVWLITTHEIDSKTLLTFYDDSPTIQQDKIRIIDGAKLADLITRKAPELIKDLLGIDFEIKNKLTPKFSNDILLRALGKDRVKDIKMIYTDVDFSIGKQTTELFFNTSFDPKTKTITLNFDEWKKFQNLCLEIKNDFNLSFLEQDVHIIKEKYLKKEQAYNDNSTEIQLLQEQINYLNNENNLSTENINQEITKINAIKKSSKPTISTEERLKIDNIDSIIKYHRSKIAINQNSIQTQSKKQKLLKLKNDNFKVRIKIIGKDLCEQILAKRKYIENGIELINNKKYNQKELKDFIGKCDNIINQCSKFFEFQNRDFKETLGTKSNYTYGEHLNNIRFRLPINEVFETGLNISVLGEAGAGKSTSLEMFAHKKKESEKKVFFLPLGYIIKDFKFSFSNDKINSSEYIEELIIFYLKKIEVFINLHELKKHLSDRKTIIIFDGLDEAIKLQPDLPDLIKSFSKIYTKIQFIISSRYYGEYINKIPFFSVTLLPFTDNQRIEFIKKWFTDGDISIQKKVLNHLNQNEEMDKIIRNPLLTTTLCVLAENGLSLPTTEIRLYEERLKLFCGYYDNVKHISTRITSLPSLLENISQKIAFHLHSCNAREMDLKNITKNILKTLKYKYTKIEIEKGIEELISPCEILVPMTGNKNYGFGHLRFQEHLVAKEIASNRQIDYFKYIKTEWWYGPILLYLYISNDFEFFIKALGDKGLINSPIVNFIFNSIKGPIEYLTSDLIEKYQVIETGGVKNDNYDNIEDIRF